MNPLSQIGVLAVACAVAFGAGFYTNHKFNQASQVVAGKKAVATTAQDVQHAQVASQKLEASAAVVAANVDQNKSAIHQRVAAQIKRQASARVTAAHARPASTPTDETHHEKNHDATNPAAGLACDGFYLDVGTVRMLNASRAGAAFHPAGSGDEALDTAPALCFTDFIDADEDLTKLYLDLAARHDALVDSVEHFQAEQRERLGVRDTPASEAAQ